MNTCDCGCGAGFRSYWVRYPSGRRFTIVGALHAGRLDPAALVVTPMIIDPSTRAIVLDPRAEIMDAATGTIVFTGCTTAELEAEGARTRCTQEG